MYFMIIKYQQLFYHPGTCYGLTLLAVLFIAKKEVKIANVLMSSSKKGEFLADLCVEALKWVTV